jgi:hypothetical protein
MVQRVYDVQNGSGWRMVKKGEGGAAGTGYWYRLLA